MDPPESLDRRELSETLTTIPTLRPEPIVILQPAGSASCEVVEAIRTEMNEKLDCANGQCGEGSGWFELPGMPIVG